MTTIYQGEARDLLFTVKTASGGVKDLTGALVVWRMQRVVAGVGSEEVLEKNAVVPTGASGEAVVTLAAHDTDLLPGVYFHELRVSLDGAVVTVFQGRVTIARSIFS